MVCIMNPSNTSKLLVAYPLLYRNLREWRFECGNGWFNLVWQLSADVEAAARIEGIPETAESWPSVTILKQKCGALRVQFEGSVGEPIRALANKAGERSIETCESCGASAKVENHGKWVKALCEKCQNKQPSPQQPQDQSRPLPFWMLERNNR